MRGRGCRQIYSTHLKSLRFPLFLSVSVIVIKLAMIGNNGYVDTRLFISTQYPKIS